MKLLTHRQIPAEKLKPLQQAVDAVVASRAAFENAAEELTAACKQIPRPEQAPQDKKKLAAWESKCEDRKRKAAICEEAVEAALEKLADGNTALRAAVETFRAFAAELLAADTSEGARRATLNVLSTDELCADVEDLINEQRRDRKPSFLDSIVLRQMFLANQRHYTVRLRVDSAKWAYLQNRKGDIKADRPAVPCLTFSEAQERCMQMGRNVDAKTMHMGYEVQCYDLVNKQRCGVAVCRSMGQMPRAED
jgi:hypothetical protein